MSIREWLFGTPVPPAPITRAIQWRTDWKCWTATRGGDERMLELHHGMSPRDRTPAQLAQFAAWEFLDARPLDRPELWIDAAMAALKELKP